MSVLERFRTEANAAYNGHTIAVAAWGIGLVIVVLLVKIIFL